MNNIWQSLGDASASKWHVEWTERQRKAGLSIQQANRYGNLIRSAPALALVHAAELNKSAIEAVAKCVDAEVLADPNGASHQTFGPLDQSVQLCLNQVAADYAMRMPNGVGLRNVAQIESEKVTRHLNALSHTLAQLVTQRALECGRSDAANIRAVKEATHANVRHWAYLFSVVATPLVGGLLAWLDHAITGGLVVVAALTVVLVTWHRKNDAI